MSGRTTIVNIQYLILAAGLIGSISQLSSAAEFQEEGDPPWIGGVGISERVQEILEEAREHHEEVAQGERHRRFTAEGVNLHRVASDSPNASQYPPPDSGQTLPGPYGASPSGINFTGATLTDTGAFPPDSMGAVGPAQFIVAVNGRIRSFDKSTGLADGVINVDTDVFFAPVMTPISGSVIGNFTSDPRIRYDRLSGRWFIIMIDVPYTSTNPFTTTVNRVMIAVSDSGTITNASVWTFFQFQHDTVGSDTADRGKFADYPTLGIDANVLYIGVNVFNNSGTGSFFNSTAFVVRKTSILGAGPIVVTAFRKLQAGSGSGLYTPQGVDNFDPAATQGYFIGVDGQFYGRLNIRRISNPGGTPSISSNVQFTVNATGGTLTVPHLGNTGGTNGNLDGLDYRLMNAVMRNGHVWTCANIGVNNTGTTGSATRDGIRWYEIQNLTGTPTVVQSGTLFDSSANQASYWMGSIMVSGQGHALIGCSAAGPNDHANAAFASRLATDSLGTLRAPVLYTSSATAYNPPNDPGGASGRRWGDYSFTSLDPCDDMSMWTIQEFCNSTNSYGVRVLKVLAPPPATPASASPSSVQSGQASVNVTITGTQIDGSGFYDPGAGFSCRIGASVSGGVIVNGVTYTDPTHVTLNLSTVSASAGNQTVTITNPDGQSATSATAILTITSSCSPDTLPPVITSCGLDQTGSANGSCQAMVLDFTAAVTATDNCTSSGSLVKTQSPIAGTLVGLGPTTVTVTVKDASNNMATCTRTFTVSDTTAPSINSCGPDTGATADASCQAVLPDLRGSVSAGDGCTSTGSLTLTQSPVLGTVLGLGPHTITITVKDAANNQSTCTKSFSVTSPDSDGDGTPDCQDGCPSDPNKIAPGICGCGVSDTDTDGDSVPDCHDNCPGLANADQGDRDHNGVGDACEPTRSILHWRSVRTHAGLGALPIELDKATSGNGISGPTAESRTGGIQRIEIVFDGSVALTDGAAILVVGQTTSAGVPGPLTSYSPDSVSLAAPDTIALVFNSGTLPDQTCYTLTVGATTIGENLGGDADCMVRSLAGDVTSSGGITLSDAIAVSVRLGQSVPANPEFDLDCDGSIALPDALIAKSVLGHQAMCP